MWEWGSHCDACIFEELTGRYRNNRKSLPAAAISTQHLIVGNDYALNLYFQGLLKAW